MKNLSKVDVVLGLQWGDEGKGKIVDALCLNYDVIARFQGGPNAGHTLEFDGKKHVLRTIPSGIFHTDKINLIGSGVVIDPLILKKENDLLKQQGVDTRKNLKISNKAHLILPSHRLLDAAYEHAKGANKIGTTLKGIGPTYTDKTTRRGLRVCDAMAADFQEKYNCLKEAHIGIFNSLNFDWQNQEIDGMNPNEYETKWLEAVKELNDFDIVSSEHFINDLLRQGKRVLAEGAQGTLLDIDFGSYPFVTSSNTTTAGVCTGLGVAPTNIGKVYGVFKAYCTRVGSGPFPTELHDNCGEELRQKGFEFGSVTGRPRRCGWLDLPALRYSIMLNGVSDLIITKADVMDDFDSIKICTEYEQNGSRTPLFVSTEKLDSVKPVYTEMQGWKTDLRKAKQRPELPKAMQEYLKFVETQVETPITIVSTGPDRTETIF